MASIGIAAAARLAGVNASTVHRAMQSGRLSYSTDSAGHRRIDVAELGRAFELKSGRDPDLLGDTGTIAGNGAHKVQSKTVHNGENGALHRLLDERERTIAQYLETIRDLRARLDLEAAERRQLSERLHGLLTARTGKSSQSEDLQPDGPEQITNSFEFAAPMDKPSASSGLAIPHPPWWRRWFR